MGLIQKGSTLEKKKQHFDKQKNINYGWNRSVMKITNKNRITKWKKIYSKSNRPLAKVSIFSL